MDSIKALLHNYPSWIISCCLWTLGGVVVGFLIKNFGKIIFYSLILFFILLLLFYYLKIVTVNISVVKGFLGLSSISSVDAAARFYVSVLRNNIISCVGFVIGFIIGWRFS
jgi:hypothetical protein